MKSLHYICKKLTIITFFQMKYLEIKTRISVCQPHELSEKEMQVVNAAKEACNSSYSPYSQFSVGVALLLSDGKVVIGSNQENAAYPSGMCAERVALYQAGALFPKTPITIMAIAARTQEGFTPHPCTPCGACRQVMLESELRQNGQPIQMVLYGTQECYRINDGTQALLPLQFNHKTMNL